jgi:hypothetical protein
MANSSVREDDQNVTFLYLIVTSNGSHEAPDIPVQAVYWIQTFICDTDAWVLLRTGQGLSLYP